MKKADKSWHITAQKNKKEKEKKYLGLGGTTNKTLLLLAFSQHFYTNQSTNIQPKIGVI